MKGEMIGPRHKSPGGRTMMNPERVASDRQLPDASAVSAEAQDCVKFFCTTLAGLNKINEEQIQGLVKIVITIAETFRSLSSSKPDEEVKRRAGTVGDE